MAKLALALALAPAVTAFAPVAAPKASTQLQASITETLATMEGPEIFWGSDGVLLGHDEADIKGYDNFDQLASALSSNGVDLSGGEYTLLAPANSAFDKHNNDGDQYVKHSKANCRIKDNGCHSHEHNRGYIGR